METVRKLVKEFNSVRASVIGTSVVVGASKCSASAGTGTGTGRGGGGIDMFNDVDVMNLDVGMPCAAFVYGRGQTI